MTLSSETRALLWAIIRFVAMVLWTILRICWIVLMALFFGGMRGASKAKMKSSADK